MIPKTARLCLLIGCTLFLSACDSLKNDSLNNICKQFPALCAELPATTDCRYKRTTLIRARYYDHIEPSDLHTRQLLDQLNDYHLCMEATLHLEFTRNKQRKARRLESYLKADALMIETLERVKDTQDPMLAYYLWTKHKDMRARQVFLKAALQKDVSDPRLLFKLATTEIPYNTQQTIDMFYRALQISTSIEQVPTPNVLLIMNIFYQHKQFEVAYLWALVAQKQDRHQEYPINLDLILRGGIASAARLINTDTEQKLQAQADHYFLQLEQGNFNEPAIKLENNE